MALATTTTLSSMIQAKMQRAMQARIAEALFFPGGPLHSTMRIADLSNSPGISATFNLYGSLTAYDMEEGVDVAVVDSMTAAATTLTATERMVPTYITNLALSAVVDPNAMQAMMGDTAEAHIQAHAAKMDQEVFALASSLTSGYSSTGANLTIAGVQAAVAKLHEVDAPGPYYGVISWQQWADLETEASSPLADASKSGVIGEQMWMDNIVPRFLGVNWFRTSALSSAIDATDDWGFIYSPRCFGCVVKAFPGSTGSVEVVDLPKSNSKFIKSTSTYAVGVLEAACGVYLKTGTS